MTSRLDETIPLLDPGLGLDLFCNYVSFKSGTTSTEEQIAYIASPFFSVVHLTTNGSARNVPSNRFSTGGEVSNSIVKWLRSVSRLLVQ